MKKQSTEWGKKKCLISRTYKKQNKTRKHNLKMGYGTKYPVFKRKILTKKYFFKMCNILSHQSNAN